MNQHPQSKLQNSPWSNKVDVTLSECRFACQRDASTRSTVDNTFDFLESVQVFVSLLAHRTSRLTLDVGDCPSILEALCDFPQVEMNTWIITKREISASECKRLAACVQRSVHLNHLDVKTTHIEEPHMLRKALANALNLRSVAFEDVSGSQRNDPALIDTLVGTERKGLVWCLLQSGLQTLSLSAPE